MNNKTYATRDEICKHCGLPIRIEANNPICDHIYYPENCDTCRVNNKTDAIKQSMEERKKYLILCIQERMPLGATIQVIDEVLALAHAEWEKRNDTHIAYCSCGDALERTGLYPEESLYYCIGCDKTYKLTPSSTQKGVDQKFLDEVAERHNKDYPAGYWEGGGHPTGIAEEKRCRQCQLENNLGVCDRRDCSNFKGLGEETNYMVDGKPMGLVQCDDCGAMKGAGKVCACQLQKEEKHG